MNNVLDLLIELVQRLSVFALVFLLMIRFPVCKRLLTGTATGSEKISMSLLFGCMGIAATYGGIGVEGAIVNLRSIPVALAGILGGPLVGFLAGVIAGAHRYFVDMGSLTAQACAIATVATGLFGGVMYHRLKRRAFDPLSALITGCTAEAVKMLIILLMIRPFDAAVNIVSAISFPTIAVNGLGLALFVELVSSLFREQDRIAARRAQTALDIAFQTLPFLKSGLNETSAEQTARIILDRTNLDAVAISDCRHILAHVGAEKAHHTADAHFLTSAADRVLRNGIMVIAETRADIGCRTVSCTLGSAVMVPLTKSEQIVGVLELYRLGERSITPLDVELAQGLAHLFSYQLEISEMELQKRLRAEAEVRALQAQINPHFLFNTITTIMGYVWTDPKTASDLLTKMADFFRKNIKPSKRSVSLAEELEHCDNYLCIEKARFEDRIAVRYEVDEHILPCRIPPLTLQPIVENSIKHGLLAREKGGIITISAHQNNEHVCIAIHDDGVGMTAEECRSLLDESDGRPKKGGLGIALKNINARLMALNGHGGGLQIESSPDAGTTVSFRIPLIEHEHQNMYN